MAEDSAPLLLVYMERVRRMNLREQRRIQYGESQMEAPLMKRIPNQQLPNVFEARAALTPRVQRSKADVFGTALGYVVAAGVGGTLGASVVAATVIGCFVGIRALIRVVWTG